MSENHGETGFRNPLERESARLNEAMAPKGGTARRRFENGFA